MVIRGTLFGEGGVHLNNHGVEFSTETNALVALEVFHPKEATDLQVDARSQ